MARTAPHGESNRIRGALPPAGSMLARRAQFRLDIIFPRKLPSVNRILPMPAMLGKPSDANRLEARELRNAQ